MKYFYPKFGHSRRQSKRPFLQAHGLLLALAFRSAPPCLALAMACAPGGMEEADPAEDASAAKVSYRRANGKVYLSLAGSVEASVIKKAGEELLGEEIAWRTQLDGPTPSTEGKFNNIPGLRVIEAETIVNPSAPGQVSTDPQPGSPSALASVWAKAIAKAPYNANVLPSQPKWSLFPFVYDTDHHDRPCTQVSYLDNESIPDDINDAEAIFLENLYRILMSRVIHSSSGGVSSLGTYAKLFSVSSTASINNPLSSQGDVFVVPFGISALNLGVNAAPVTLRVAEELENRVLYFKGSEFLGNNMQLKSATALSDDEPGLVVLYFLEPRKRVSPEHPGALFLSDS